MEGGLRQLSAFMQVSLDGRFADAAAEISFAHQQAADAEWHQFMAENAAAGGADVWPDHIRPDGIVVADAGGREGDA